MPPSLRKSASSTSIARRNSAYVDVPAAPYLTPRQNMVDTAGGTSSSKENTPLRPNRGSKVLPSESLSDTRKRKNSDALHKIVDRSTRTEPSAKKVKLSEPESESGRQDRHEDAIGSANGGDIYCHQCNRKRSWSSQ